MVAVKGRNAPRIFGAAVLLSVLAGCDEDPHEKAVEQMQRMYVSVRSLPDSGALYASYQANRTCLAQHQDDPGAECLAFELAWHADLVEYIMLHGRGAGIMTERLAREGATTEASLAAYKSCLTGHLSDPEYACDAGRRTYLADVTEYVTLRNSEASRQASAQ